MYGGGQRLRRENGQQLEISEHRITGRKMMQQSLASSVHLRPLHTQNQKNRKNQKKKQSATQTLWGTAANLAWWSLFFFFFFCFFFLGFRFSPLRAHFMLLFVFFWFLWFLRFSPLRAQFMWQFVFLCFRDSTHPSCCSFLVLVLRNAGCKNPTLATLLSVFETTRLFCNIRCCFVFFWDSPTLAVLLHLCLVSLAFAL